MPPPHQAWDGQGWSHDPVVIDDQALVISVRDQGLVIITGCGHAGVVNIIRHAMRLTGVRRLLAVIGGFHLSGPAFEPVIAPTVAALTELAPEADRPGPLHRLARPARPGGGPAARLGAVQRRNHLHLRRRLTSCRDCSDGWGRQLLRRVWRSDQSPARPWRRCSWPRSRPRRAGRRRGRARCLLRPLAPGAALVAGDARVGRVHEDHSPSSVFRFGFEDHRELRPARIEDRLAQPRLGGAPVREVRAGLPGVGLRRGAPGHPGRVQVFECDHVAFADQPARGLVVEVEPAVAGLAPFPGQCPAQPLAVTRARLGALLTALQVPINPADSPRNRGLLRLHRRWW